MPEEYAEAVTPAPAEEPAMSRRSGAHPAIAAARMAAGRAHAPYSGFRVGAVLEDCDGRLHAGCNVECASLGLSLCAERTALGVAVTAGASAFRRIWIYTPTSQPTSPCGACRELLRGIAPDLDVVLVSEDRVSRPIPLSRLLPGGAKPIRRRS